MSRHPKVPEIASQMLAEIRFPEGGHFFLLRYFQQTETYFYLLIFVKIC